MSIGGENRFLYEEQQSPPAPPPIPGVDTFAPPPPPPPPPPPAPAPEVIPASGTDDSIGWSDAFAQAFTPPPAPPMEYGIDTFAPPPPVPPAPTYVTNEQYFGSDWNPVTGQPNAPSLTDYVDTSGFSQFYDPMNPNTGPGAWFGTDAQVEQQIAWFNSEMTKAVMSGDTKRQQELQAEIDAVNAAYSAYNQQVPNFQAYGGAVDQFNDRFGPVYDGRGQGLLGPAVNDTAINQAAWTNMWQTERTGNAVLSNRYFDQQQGNLPFDRSVYLPGSNRHLYEQMGNIPQPEPTFGQIFGQLPTSVQESVMTMLDEYNAYQQFREDERRVATEMGDLSRNRDELAWWSGRNTGGLAIPGTVTSVMDAFAKYAGGAVAFTDDTIASIRSFFEQGPTTQLEAGLHQNQPGTYRSQGGAPPSAFSRSLDQAALDIGENVGEVGLRDMIIPALTQIVLPALTYPQEALWTGVVAPAVGMPANLRNIATGLGLREGEFNRNPEQMNREAAAILNRWEEEHPWLYLLASLPADPWNYIGLGYAQELARLGKSSYTTRVAMRNVLTEKEAQVLFDARPSWTTMNKWRTTADYLATNTGLSKIGDTKIRDALAFRLASLGSVGKATGADLTPYWRREIENLPQLAERMGLDNAQVTELRRLLDDSPRGPRSIDIALGQADLRWRAANGLTPQGQAVRPNGLVTPLPRGQETVRFQSWNTGLSRVNVPKTPEQTVEATTVDLLAALDAVPPTKNVMSYGPYRFVNLAGNVAPSPTAAALTPTPEAVTPPSGIEGTPLGTLPRQADAVPTPIRTGYDNPHNIIWSPEWPAHARQRLQRLRIAGKITPAQERAAAEWGNKRLAKFLEQHMTPYEPHLVKVDPNDPFSDYIDPSDLVAKGHNLDLSDNGTVETVRAAANDDALRATAVEQWGAMQPRVGPHPNIGYSAAGYQRVMTENVVRLNLEQFQILLRDHYSELKETSFKGVVDEILAMTPLLKTSGEMSSTSVRGALDQALAEISERIANGMTPADDVQRFLAMLHESAFTDLDEIAARRLAATRLWNKLKPAQVEKKMEELRLLKEQAGVEKAAWHAARGPAKERARQALEQTVARIRVWVPTYRPVPAKVPRAAKAAAQHVETQTAIIQPQAMAVEAERMAAEAALLANPEDALAVQAFADATERADALAAVVPESTPDTFRPETQGADTTAAVLGREARGEVAPDTTVPVIGLDLNANLARSVALLERAEAVVRKTPDLLEGAFGQLSNIPMVYPRHLMKEMGVDRATADRLLAQLEHDGIVGKKNRMGGRKVQPERPAAFPEAAGGGGDGMAFISGPSLNLPPEVTGALHWAESQGRRALTYRPTPKPVIDLTASGWRDFTWRSAEEAARYDAYMGKVYNYDEFAKGDPRQLGQLQKSARVALAGDVASQYMRRIMDQAYHGEGKDSPTQFVLDHLRALRDAQVDDLIAGKDGLVDDSWLMTKTGRDNLRVLRQHLPTIIERVEKGNYSAFVSLRGLQAHLPAAPNGQWDYKALKELDTLLTRTSKPQNMPWREWERVRAIQNALKEPWEKLKADPQFYDPETKKWLPDDMAGALTQRAEAQLGVDTAFADFNMLKARHEEAKLAFTRFEATLRGKRTQAQFDMLNTLKIARDEAGVAAAQAGRRIDEAKRVLAEAKKVGAATTTVSPEAIFAALEPEDAAKAVDINRMAEDIGLDISELHAEALDFDPDSMYSGGRWMATIKGNLSPLWMGMVPGYYIRNALGNTASHLMGAINGDMRVGANAFRAPKWVKEVMDEPGAGTGFHRWMDVGVTGRTGAGTDVGTLGPGKQEYWVPRQLDKIPLIGSKRSFGKRGYYKSMQHYGGDIPEMFAKRNVYTQEWGWTYSDQWRKRIAERVTDPAARDALTNVRGHNQLTIKMNDLGLDDATKQMLRSQMDASIGMADMKAYETTARVLRDYRMRNRLDGILDRIIPVHYWATKNAMFVGRTAASRPGSVPAAMTALDNWDEHNQHLPLSMRTGLLPISGKYVPFVDDEDTYYLRASSFINPAIFAVAKFADPKKWDLSKTSLPDRFDGWAALGLRNGYQAMGYRVGPQFDIGSKLLSAFAQNTKLGDYRGIRALSDMSNWVAGAGYRTDLIPLVPYLQQAQNVRSAVIPGTNISPMDLFEAGNQFIYGTPYSRFEMNNFGYKAAEWVQNGQMTKEQQQVVLKALADGKFDYDPEYAAQLIGPNSNPNMSDEELDAALHMVRDVIEATLSDRAGSYTASLAGAGGKVWSKGNQQQEDESRRYGIASSLERASGFPGLKGLAAFAASDWGRLEASARQQEEYDRRVRDYGRGSANLWLWREASALPAFWAANDSPAIASQRLEDNNIEANQDAAYELGAAMRDEFYATQNASINAAAPYWDRLRIAGEVRDNMVAAAGDNMRYVALAEEQYRAARADVYADAERDGIPMTGSGRMPTKSSQSYDRTSAENKFLEWNDALPQVEQYEVGVQQQQWFMDQLIAQHGLEPFTYKGDQAIPNKKFVDEDGKFDQAAYMAAIKEIAPTIDQEYRSLVQEAIREGLPVAPTASATNITQADFITYVTPKTNEKLDAFYAQRTADFAAAKAMPTGTPEQFEAQRAAYDALTIKYGAEGKPHEAAGGFTAKEHADYAYGTDLARDYYSTLTPKDRAAFRAEYPHAFDADGKFSATLLHSEDLPKIINQNRLGEGNLGVPEGHVDTATANRYGETQRIFALKDERDQNLTPEQTAALDEFSNHTFDDDALYSEAKEWKAREGGWIAAQEAAQASGRDDLYTFIKDYLAKSNAAGDAGAYRVQDDWFFNLSENDRNLLMAQDPSFEKYAGQSPEAYFLEQQFYDGNYLTPEQKAALEEVKNYRQDHPELEEAAWNLRELMGIDTPWKDVAKVATGEVAAYINGRSDRTGAAAKTGAYDVQEEWFASLSPDQQQLLIESNPDSFSRFANTDAGVPGTQSGGQPAQSSGGGQPRTGSGSTYSGGSSTTSGRTSGGSARVGSGTTLPGAGNVDVPAWLQAFLSSPGLTTEQRQALLNIFMAYYQGPGGPGTPPYRAKGSRPMAAD